MNEILIDVVYEAKTALGPGANVKSLGDLVQALQLQVDRDFTPVWGVSCSLSIQTTPIPYHWRLIFLDDSDQADALGYHEVGPDGQPQGKVFVKTTIDDKENPTVTASHELLEMLGDPQVDSTAVRATDRRVYALEVCDAVEETSYKINGVTMSNFMLPSWFGLPGTPGAFAKQYDFLKLCDKPFELLKGGYMSILEDGQWNQIFASTRAADAFRTEKKWRPQCRESGVKVRSER